MRKWKKFGHWWFWWVSCLTLCLVFSSRSAVALPTILFGHKNLGEKYCNRHVQLHCFYLLWFIFYLRFVRFLTKKLCLAHFLSVWRAALSLTIFWAVATRNTSQMHSSIYDLPQAPWQVDNYLLNSHTFEYPYWVRIFVRYHLQGSWSYIRDSSHFWPSHFKDRFVLYVKPCTK